MTTTSTLERGRFPGQHWTWRDRPVYYVHAGQSPNASRPPLLLVHGFGASTDHWRKTIEGLQDEFEIWAIDLLGFGRSGKPPLAYSGELWRDQLHDFIQEVIGQPVVLAGNSLGGYVCLCVAAQKPESARGLVLLNSAGPFSDTQPRQPSRFSRMLRRFALQDWVAFLIFQNTRRRSVIRKTLEKVYVDKSAVTDRLVEEIYRPSCDRGAAKVFASVFKTPRGATVDELLSQLNKPLLMVWGEGDPWMNSKDRSAKFRQYYPNLSEQFLNAGHCPHDEVPDQVNAHLKSWVLELE
ncbi:MAG: alpha/beta fold hydrolase [Sodalinema sp.]|uniref:alpha/beta fold hydrolase n=1 Tax=Sodalinema sp. TaxID=3080550 RepID=UPI00396F34B0